MSCVCHGGYLRTHSVEETMHIMFSEFNDQTFPSL